MKCLRDLIKEQLEETDVPLSVVSVKSGVPYGALHYFKKTGGDMRSEYMEKLYQYFTGKNLLDKDNER